ncbi:MAG TPA: 3-deoxy-manno-octulosonate cytidylyltransferase [Bacteroidales bacterium]|nr:3-deoxy-manno-octulosonate cytidylyltransferase [Bacteroidales bacterium]
MKTFTGAHFTGIIPARYSSSRFPGKPLALIGGKPMIRLVYEQATRALDSVYVATDDERIMNAVESFGGKAVMTSTVHRSGTDRCAEAAQIIANKTGADPEVIINIQGDEPFILPEQISLLADCFTDKSVEIATLVSRIKENNDIFNINETKVARSLAGDALYFSRSPIPFIRGAEKEEWLQKYPFYKHLGVYAYRFSTLSELTKLNPGELETAESLEQNRWLEHGYRIRTAVTDWEGIGIDIPEDLEKASEFLKSFN